MVNDITIHSDGEVKHENEKVGIPNQEKAKRKMKEKAELYGALEELKNGY